MYLAILFNSTVIDINDDNLLISYSFWGCQSLKYIATCYLRFEGERWKNLQFENFLNKTLMSPMFLDIVYLL